jgi:hypothetical protein
MSEETNPNDDARKYDPFTLSPILNHLVSRADRILLKILIEKGVLDEWRVERAYTEATYPRAQRSVARPGGAGSFGLGSDIQISRAMEAAGFAGNDYAFLAMGGKVHFLTYAVSFPGDDPLTEKGNRDWSPEMLSLANVLRAKKRLKRLAEKANADLEKFDNENEAELAVIDRLLKESE